MTPTPTRSTAAAVASGLLLAALLAQGCRKKQVTPPPAPVPVPVETPAAKPAPRPVARAPVFVPPEPPPPAPMEAPAVAPKPSETGTPLPTYVPSTSTRGREPLWRQRAKHY